MVQASSFQQTIMIRDQIIRAEACVAQAFHLAPLIVALCKQMVIEESEDARDL